MIWPFLEIVFLDFLGFCFSIPLFVCYILRYFMGHQTPARICWFWIRSFYDNVVFNYVRGKCCFCNRYNEHDNPGYFPTWLFWVALIKLILKGILSYILFEALYKVHNFPSTTNSLKAVLNSSCRNEGGRAFYPYHNGPCNRKLVRNLRYMGAKCLGNNAHQHLALG